MVHGRALALSAGLLWLALAPRGAATANLPPFSRDIALKVVTQ